MMSKTQLINSIQQINQSARAEWLAAFEPKALQGYLDHLQITLEPRGRNSSWIRPAGTPVIVTRNPLF
ncbi:MAG: hypothetical protein IH984_12300 [Planctomycetes bacterium]|nr:hypothetical protein [Planctomycetota bacterium]